MRKYHKENILELLKTMQEVHNQIKKFIKKGQYEEVRELLAQCQDAAVHIGNCIEECGQDISIVQDLETYCEELFDIYRQVEEVPVSSCKKIDNTIIHIENRIHKEIEVKLQIVFLPYKASMWDSMESIWQATRDDERCECYVMPIPYFERNSNGTLGEMHYEGDNLPEYVPIVNWREFDLSVEQPDIIYIHNPYDGNNFVTTVHPSFYTEQLKKYTDMLVYVPYYCTGGTLAESFYNLPSYHNVHKIIIQSQGIKNFYDHSVWSKLVALGTPKFDKVLNSSKLEIPSEWVERIKNRKVVLYNTSLSSILEYNEEALKKIQSIFEYFKQRTDVVLMWRPHPLTESSLASMRLHLVQQYNKLKEEYITQNIGIYDDTADVTNSVKLADAYIGEETSSIVHLFGVQAKPIFLLNMKLHDTQEMKDIPLNYYYAHKRDKEIWAVTGDSCVICKTDLESGKTETVARIKNEGLETNRLYNHIVEVDNKLIFIPYNATEICEYDLVNETLKKVRFNAPVLGNFSKGVVYKDSVYMIPAKYNAILEYKLKSGECKYHKTIAKYKELSNGYETDPICLNGVCQRDNLILMALARSNMVLEFNMDTKQLKHYLVGNEANNYWGMTYDGEDYWLIPNRSKSIVKWQYASDKVEEFTHYPEAFNGETQCFFDAVACEKYIIVFPKYANMILKIDKATGEISELSLDVPYQEGKRQSEYFNWPSNYYFVNKIGANKVVAMSAYDNSLLAIDVANDICERTQCLVAKSELPYGAIEKFGRCGKNLPYACRETKHTKIGEFINYVLEPSEEISNKQREVYAKISANMDGTCGEKIHQYIVKEVLIK